MTIMIEPDENEVEGLKRVLKHLKESSCTEFTGFGCETERSDECMACIHLSAAQEWLGNLLLDVQKSQGGK